MNIQFIWYDTHQVEPVKEWLVTKYSNIDIQEGFEQRFDVVANATTSGSYLFIVAINNHIECVFNINYRKSSDNKRQRSAKMYDVLSKYINTFCSEQYIQHLSKAYHKIQDELYIKRDLGMGDNTMDEKKAIKEFISLVFSQPKKNGMGIDFEHFTNWLASEDLIVVPEDIKHHYEDTHMSGRKHDTKRNQTYLYADYIQLCGLAIVMGLFTPVWQEYPSIEFKQQGLKSRKKNIKNPNPKSPIRENVNLFEGLLPMFNGSSVTNTRCYYQFAYQHNGKQYNIEQVEHPFAKLMRYVSCRAQSDFKLSSTAQTAAQLTTQLSYMGLSTDIEVITNFFTSNLLFNIVLGFDPFLPDTKRGTDKFYPHNPITHISTEFDGFKRKIEKGEANLGNNIKIKTFKDKEGASPDDSENKDMIDEFRSQTEYTAADMALNQYALKDVHLLSSYLGLIKEDMPAVEAIIDDLHNMYNDACVQAQEWDLKSGDMVDLTESERREKRKNANRRNKMLNNITGFNKPQMYLLTAILFNYCVEEAIHHLTLEETFQLKAMIAVYLRTLADRELFVPQDMNITQEDVEQTFLAYSFIMYIPPMFNYTLDDVETRIPDGKCIENEYVANEFYSKYISNDLHGGQTIDPLIKGKIDDIIKELAKSLTYRYDCVNNIENPPLALTTENYKSQRVTMAMLVALGIITSLEHHLVN